MKERPLIFVTNDDSYFSKGISVLIKLMMEFGDVVVIAPKEEMSGKSHSITSMNPIRIRLFEEKKGYMGYILSGTPVDCVKMASNRILKERKPNLLVAGINHGSNASVNTIYSGTMAAVFEGCAEGIPSVGFSIDSSDKQVDFSFCEKYIREICAAYWQEDMVEYVSPHGGKFYMLSGVYHCLDNSPEADYNCLQEGYATMVPMHIDFTDYSSMDKIKNRFENVQKK